MWIQAQGNWVLLIGCSLCCIYQILQILKKLNVGESLLGEGKVSSEGVKSLPCSVINYLNRKLNFQAKVWHFLENQSSLSLIQLKWAVLFKSNLKGILYLHILHCNYSMVIWAFLAWPHHSNSLFPSPHHQILQVLTFWCQQEYRISQSSVMMWFSTSSGSCQWSHWQA